MDVDVREVFCLLVVTFVILGIRVEGFLEVREYGRDVLSEVGEFEEVGG